MGGAHAVRTSQYPIDIPLPIIDEPIQPFHLIFTELSAREEGWLCVELFETRARAGGGQRESTGDTCQGDTDMEDEHIAYTCD